jgi:hypothetical protein
MRRTESRQRALSLVCGLAMSSAALAAPSPQQGLSRATPKGTEPFATCFATSQDRSAQPWWFVPKAHGGTVSNLGAHGVDPPYVVDIADKGATREVRVTLASASADRSVLRAVDSCI